MEAFAAFKEKRYGEAADLFKAAAADEDQSNVRASILANAAACEYKMELNRRCLKTCDAALGEDLGCVKAHLYKGRALAALGKVEKAQAARRAGLNVCESLLGMGSDVEAWNQLALEASGELPPAPITTSAAAATLPVPPSSPMSRTTVSPPATSPIVQSSAVAASEDENTPTAALRREALAAPVAAAAVAAAEAEAASKGIDPSALAVTPTMLAQARAVLSHSSGIVSLDNAIARGYLLVNTGAYAPALALFECLLNTYPGLVAALMARGSALAMSARLPEAVACFTTALEHDPSLADSWKRRGQVQAARGDAYLEAALADLNQASELDDRKPADQPRDDDLWHQKGAVLHRLKDFQAALPCFETLVRLDPSHAIGWNYVGLCRAQLGDVGLALGAYERAASLDPKFKEAWVNLAQLHKEAGAGAVSLQAFNQAIVLDASRSQTFYLRGLLEHGLGYPMKALKDFTEASKLDPEHAPSRYMTGVCLQSVGRFQAAAAAYRKCLEIDPGHGQAFYAKQLCAYYQRRLDAVPQRLRSEGKDSDGVTSSSRNSMLIGGDVNASADSEVNCYLKDAMCKRADSRQELNMGKLKDYALMEVQKEIPEVTSNQGAVSSLSKELAAVVAAADRVGRFIVLNNCKGFLENRRQVRQLGFSALQLGQRLLQHWQQLAAAAAVHNGETTSSLDEITPQVPNAWSSRSPSYYHESAPTTSSHHHHLFDWRDAFDVVVRWRQLSEPNDPVWWIDRLSPEAFQEGFGLQTPLVNGQLKVIRYFPYFAPAFALMKELIVEMMHNKAGLNDASAIGTVRAMTTLEELYDAWGKGDFWVVSPCESSAIPGKVLEGTRLTVQRKVSPDGFEFTIRTPGTPGRWQEYEVEMTHAWQALQELAVKDEQRLRQSRRKHEEGDASPSSYEFSFKEAILEASLTVFFYWVNFGPLSRGSAACGYAVLRACLAAVGYHLELPALPPNKQLDWEAILRPNPASFIAHVKPWLLPKLSLRRRASSSSSSSSASSSPEEGAHDTNGEGGDVLASLPNIDAVLPTLRTTIEALNAGD